MKSKFIDLLLYALLFVFVAAFPVDRFPIDPIYQTVIQIGLRVLLIGFYIYLIAKNKVKIFGIASFKFILFCIPFFLACFSNIIASQINGGVSPSQMGAEMLAVNIVLSFVIAVSEEILFRLFIHNSLTNCGSFKRILGSAGIFAAMHLLNLASVASVDALVTVLVQVVYDFGLGLMLGFLYEYSHSLTSCVILHFSFNLFNQVLVQYFGLTSSPICFYLTAIIIAIVLVAYALVIYFFYIQKMDRYFK